MQITLSQLKSHLWDSANILRGPPSTADWKAYILPLLFFKRICDVWDEETTEAVENPAMSIPRVPRSPPLLSSGGLSLEGRPRDRANVGACCTPCRRSRRPTPTPSTGSSGTLTGATERMLTDELLKDLIEGFSRLSARQSVGRIRCSRRRLRVPDREVRRRHQRKKAGEFYTPRSVVRHDGRDARPEGRRDHLRPGLRHRRHAARRHRTREAERRRPAHLLRARSTVRRRTSPPRPSPA